MLRCRPQPSSSSPARVFVPLETSPLKRSKRIINAANLKRCKSESRIASRSVCAFPVSVAARKSVDRVEGGRNLEGEVIKLKGEGRFWNESPNPWRYTLDPGWRGLRFRYSEFQGFGRGTTQPFLASWCAATSPGGDQRSFPQTPILASFLPSLSFHCTVVRMHHSIHVSFLRSVSSRPLVRYIYSLDRKLVVVANRDEIFVIRVSLDKYFPLST